MTRPRKYTDHRIGLLDHVSDGSQEGDRVAATHAHLVAQAARINAMRAACPAGGDCECRDSCAAVIAPPVAVAPPQATALEWLSWFYSHADFGPADGDVRARLQRQFVKSTGKLIPLGYAPEDEEDDQ